MARSRKRYVLKSKRRFFSIIIIATLLCLTLGGLAWGYDYIKSIAKSISVPSAASSNKLLGGLIAAEPTKRPEPENRVNILVMGIANNMSDTIMLCSFFPKTGALDIVSIPRDTYIRQTEHRYDSAYNKVNSNYAKGGAPHITKLVKDFSKVDINYYVEINYDAVKEIIDAIGGLNITVAENMNYDDNVDGLHIHFKKGDVVTKGEDIIKVLRWRKNNHNRGGYGTGDIGRIEFQHQVVKQGIEKIISGNPISTLVKIKKPLEDHIRTDMSADDILFYMGLMPKINKDKITLQTIPGLASMVGHLSFYLPYPEADKQLFDVFINNKDMPQPLPSTLPVTETIEAPKK